ncbi:MAG: aquaporin [Oligoflexia bacterium]|nr:aquaporin [Oligoflexia bacterium]
MKLAPRLFCEFIGTFALVFAGVGAICNNAGLLGVALAHGFSLIVMISALGYISGAHFNPAVSLALSSIGKIAPTEAFAYVVAQLVAAVFAMFCLGALFPEQAMQAGGFGVPALAPSLTVSQGALAEFLMTFFLMLVILGTAVDGRAPKCGGVFIGMCVMMDILCGGPLTGAAMNPARAFGPALYAGMWSGHILYWVAPIAGAVVAAQLYRVLLAQD